MSISELASITVYSDYLEKRELSLFTTNGKSSESGCSIVFGANGTGKSTLARAIRGSISPSGSSPSNESCTFHRGDRSKIRINPDDKNVHVFDEGYIHDNFRSISKNTVDEIVLIGSSAKVQSEIDEIDQELQSNEKELTKAKQEADFYNGSLEEARKEMHKRVSDGKDNWRHRSQLYHPNRTLPNVRNEWLTRIVGAELPETPLSELYEAFDNKIIELETAQKFVPIDWQAPEIAPKFDPNLIQEGLDSLKVIETSESDGELFARVAGSKTSISNLNELEKTVLAETTEFCPTCFQDLRDNYKKLLYDVVKKIVQQHFDNSQVANLRNMKFNWRVPNIELPNIEISDDLRKGLFDDIENVNAACDTVNARIQEKIDNPNEDISISDQNFDLLLKNLRNTLTRIQEEVANYNSQKVSKDELRSACGRLNEEITIHETRAEANKWKSAEKKYSEAKEEVDRLVTKREDFERRRKTKIAHLKGTTAAAHHVNKLLAIVFGSDSFRIEVVDDIGYKVTNGVSQVAPHSLSTGERNILALCYFLIQISAGKKFENTFGSDQLIVLDDPVSSFDFNNKYGVITLIRFFIEKQMQKGSRTKILILTHDPSVAFDIYKVTTGICENRYSWLLTRDDLQPLKFENIDHYRKTLQEMLDVASDEREEAPMPGPNEIRRVWEAFATFELGEKPTEVVDSYKIQHLRDELTEKEQEFMSIFVARVFIHSDSHSEQQTRKFNYELLPTLDHDGYRRFIREILTFMHLVSPLHIAGRLSSEKTVFEKNMEIISKIVNTTICRNEGSEDISIS